MTSTRPHPAAWRGPELLERNDWLVKLGPEDSLDSEAFREMLLRIQSALEHGSGATLLRGLPIENLSESEAKELFLSLTQVVGSPLSQSVEGDLVFSVRDAGFKADDPRARGPNTRKKLSFHTDRCDVIAFLCLKQARTGGENEVVSSLTLYHEIARRRPDLLEILTQPFPYKRHTIDPANRLGHCLQPIFSIYKNHFSCAFLRVLIDRAHHDPDLPSLSEKQIEALDFLESVAAEPELHVRFLQRPGDILFLNNWTTLHRRTEFEDWPNPTEKRHILRIWLSVPNSRPLDPVFADNFGDTRAGAIRGGIKPSTP
ncbi:MAG: TauD/TfdA family dioxygenase [Verrucomicrobiota bacterium]